MLAIRRGRADQGLGWHFNASGTFHNDSVRMPGGWRIHYHRLEVYFGDALKVVDRWY